MKQLGITMALYSSQSNDWNVPLQIHFVRPDTGNTENQYWMDNANFAQLSGNSKTLWLYYPRYKKSFLCSNIPNYPRESAGFEDYTNLGYVYGMTYWNTTNFVNPDSTSTWLQKKLSAEPRRAAIIAIQLNTGGSMEIRMKNRISRPPTDIRKNNMST